MSIVATPDVNMTEALMFVRQVANTNRNVASILHAWADRSNTGDLSRDRLRKTAMKEDGLAASLDALAAWAEHGDGTSVRINPSLRSFAAGTPIRHLEDGGYGCILSVSPLSVSIRLDDAAGTLSEMHPTDADRLLEVRERGPVPTLGPEWRAGR